MKILLIFMLIGLLFMVGCLKESSDPIIDYNLDEDNESIVDSGIMADDEELIIYETATETIALIDTE